MPNETTILADLIEDLGLGLQHPLQMSIATMTAVAGGLVVHGIQKVFNKIKKFFNKEDDDKEEKRTTSNTNTNSVNVVITHESETSPMKRGGRFSSIMGLIKKSNPSLDVARIERGLGEKEESDAEERSAKSKAHQLEKTKAKKYQKKSTSETTMGLTHNLELQNYGATKTDQESKRKQHTKKRNEKRIVKKKKHSSMSESETSENESSQKAHDISYDFTSSSEDERDGGTKRTSKNRKKYDPKKRRNDPQNTIASKYLERQSSGENASQNTKYVDESDQNMSEGEVRESMIKEATDKLNQILILDKKNKEKRQMLAVEKEMHKTKRHLYDESLKKQMVMMLEETKGLLQKCNKENEHKIEELQDKMQKLIIQNEEKNEEIKNLFKKVYAMNLEKKEQTTAKDAVQSKYTDSQEEEPESHFYDAVDLVDSPTKKEFDLLEIKHIEEELDKKDILSEIKHIGEEITELLESTKTTLIKQEEFIEKIEERIVGTDLVELYVNCDIRKDEVDMEFDVESNSEHEMGGHFEMHHNKISEYDPEPELQHSETPEHDSAYDVSIDVMLKLDEAKRQSKKDFTKKDKDMGHKQILSGVCLRQPKTSLDDELSQQEKILINSTLTETTASTIERQFHENPLLEAQLSTTQAMPLSNQLFEEMDSVRL